MPTIIDRARASIASIVSGQGRWSPQDQNALEAGDPSVVFGSGIARELVEGMSAGDLYETQPHLRSVVDFVSRNAAQLGRHVYRPDGNGGRERARDSQLEELMNHPNEYQTGFDLIKQLVSELALYDFHIWTLGYRKGRWVIDPIPSEWITGYSKDGFGRAVRYRIQPTGSPNWYFVEAADAIVFKGYNPSSYGRGSSAVRSLRSTLAEQISATDFRRQMWKRGGRVGMFMSRPAEAPEWSPEAKSKFIQAWKQSWSGQGAEAGGTPLLEDGMELKRVGFNAKEEQWAEGTQLSMVTCAQAFHVPPAMIGVSGYNSFASVTEFRKMLYTETLGPLVAQIEDTVNSFLVPKLALATNDYLEININEKLQGDFEAQATVMSTSVGGPWMTRNEARARVNLPALDGGDELIVPLNVTVGGQASPQDGGTGKSYQHMGVLVKAAETKGPTRLGQAQLDSLAEDLKHFFNTQQTAIAANHNQTDEWWDQKSWNRLLAAVLLPHAIGSTEAVAKQAAVKAGLDPNGYAVQRTVAFLTAVSDSRADLVNATTRDELKAILADSDDPAAAIKSYYEETNASRHEQIAATLGTFLAAWATTEMARQLIDPAAGPTKTWDSSGKPNSRHASMNGQTVPLDSKFSNGADWPGDPTLGAAQVANCGCGVTINYTS